MAGGVSTPELAAAAGDAGGLGFLAGGYRTAAELAGDIAKTRALTSAPFGVNLFVPGDDRPEPEALRAYAERISSDADLAGVTLGEPRADDDDWAAKFDGLLADPVPVVSFTFGCPTAERIAALRERGSRVWVTVTTPDEALAADAAGADALVVQGSEAGGHRAGFPAGGPEEGGEIGLLPLIALVRTVSGLPLVAAGGIMRDAAVAAVRSAGAGAAQAGTAFLLAPEAGTHPVHRAALRRPGRTALTRAFTGKPARGLVNEFMRRHSAYAPIAYPHIHHMTRPLRAAAGKAGDPDAMSLWAGQGFRLAEERPAAEIVERLSP
ncbi:MAG: nitronate monooxygenase [Streptosporangiales bacterium]|nr:nitronate monooxygenase [Streptosporangiales bacterium]